MSQPVTIRSMSRGDVYVIDRLAPSEAGKRLADLGFIPGARVEMIQAGSPCIIRIDTTCIAMGREHQECVQLAPADPSSCRAASA